MKYKGCLVLLVFYLMIMNFACERKSSEEKQTEDRKVATLRKSSWDTEAQPLNVQLTNQAWEAFNKGDYEHATTYAEKCVNEFLGGAERRQLQLEKDRAPLPPTGAVTEQEKETIFANGLLNDVATCLYIKGRSAEALGHKDEAIKAYQAAAKYTYARCWDPKGWFWSPSEASLDRLSVLR